MVRACLRTLCNGMGELLQMAGRALSEGVAEEPDPRRRGPLVDPDDRDDGPVYPVEVTPRGQAMVYRPEPPPPPAPPPAPLRGSIAARAAEARERLERG